jgi:biotin transport system substrate-specific component
MGSRSKLHTWVKEGLILIGLAVATGLAAKVAIFLPWTPVPITLQLVVVFFSGAAFGPMRGALAQFLYLAMGLSGLPVFASPLAIGPAVVLQPTFGYLLAFPLAAFFAGHGMTLKSRIWSGLAGLASIHLLGATWLVCWATWLSPTELQASTSWALFAGSLPFIPLDLVKLAVAIGSASLLANKFRR